MASDPNASQPPATPQSAMPMQPGMWLPPRDTPPSPAPPAPLSIRVIPRTAAKPPTKPAATNLAAADKRLKSGVPEWALKPGLYPDFITPNPRPAPTTGKLLYLFECPIEQDYAHPLWLEHDNTVPSVRCDVRARSTPDGKETWDPAHGPDDIVRSFTARLTRLIDLMAPHFGPRNKHVRWYAAPAAFGGFLGDKELDKWPNMHPLLNNRADRLRSNRRGPFASKGIAQNRAWSREFLDGLADVLKARRLPDPVAFMLSTENGPQDDLAGHIGDPDTGWVKEALDDRRADDARELIDGTRTFRQYFEDARTLSGERIPEYNDKAQWSNPPGRSPANAESTDRYRAALRLLWDYARHTSFGEPLKEFFTRDPSRPECVPPLGEYQAACDSPRSPVRLNPGLWMHHMDGIFHTDVQCPDWYGGWPNMGNNDAELAGAGPAIALRDNWRRVLPQVPEPRSPRDRDRVLGLEIAKMQAEQHARAAPDRPLAPYMTHNDSVPVDDAVAYIKHCRELGAWAVNVFMPGPAKRETYAFWKQVIERVEG